METTVISEQAQGDETMYGYDFSAFTNKDLLNIFSADKKRADRVIFRDKKA